MIHKGDRISLGFPPKRRSGLFAFANGSNATNDGGGLVGFSFMFGTEKSVSCFLTFSAVPTEIQCFDTINGWMNPIAIDTLGPATTFQLNYGGTLTDPTFIRIITKPTNFILKDPQNRLRTLVIPVLKAVEIP